MNYKFKMNFKVTLKNTKSVNSQGKYVVRTKIVPDSILIEQVTNIKIYHVKLLINMKKSEQNYQYFSNYNVQ